MCCICLENAHYSNFQKDITPSSASFSADAYSFGKLIGFAVKSRGTKGELFYSGVISHEVQSTVWLAWSILSDYLITLNM